MDPSQTMTANPEIAESLSLIEFDLESESFHATYDSTRDIVCACCGTPRMGRKRTPETAVVPYQDTYSEWEHENFDIRGTTGDE